MGELLRRYWQPVCTSDELNGSGGALQRKNTDECVEHEPVARRGIDVSKGGGMRAKYRTTVGGLSSVVVVGFVVWTGRSGRAP
jgi:hypothetical protein